MGKFGFLINKIGKQKSQGRQKFDKINEDKADQKEEHRKEHRETKG